MEALPESQMNNSFDVRESPRSARADIKSIRLAVPCPSALLYVWSGGDASPCWGRGAGKVTVGITGRRGKPWMNTLGAFCFFSSRKIVKPFLSWCLKPDDGRGSPHSNIGSCVSWLSSLLTLRAGHCISVCWNHAGFLSDLPSAQH